MPNDSGIPLAKLALLLALYALSQIDQASAANCCGGAKRPTDGTPSTSKNNPVLDPSKFFGRAALGYKAAKQAPDLCQKLFCYCGCDMTDSHSSLLDCFSSDHGADCQICQEEAIIGLHMQQEGKSLYRIQKAIDDAFFQQYPWDKPTTQLSRYRQSIKPEKSDAPSTKAGDANLGAPNALTPEDKISEPKSKEQ